MQLSTQNEGEAKYKIACKDLGSPDCPYIAKGNMHQADKKMDEILAAQN